MIQEALVTHQQLLPLKKNSPLLSFMNSSVKIGSKMFRGLSIILIFLQHPPLLEVGNYKMFHYGFK